MHFHKWERHGRGGGRHKGLGTCCPGSPGHTLGRCLPLSVQWGTERLNTYVLNTIPFRQLGVIVTHFILMHNVPLASIRLWLTHPKKHYLQHPILCVSHQKHACCSKHVPERYVLSSLSHGYKMMYVTFLDMLLCHCVSFVVQQHHFYWISFRSEVATWVYVFFGSEHIG